MLQLLVHASTQRATWNRITQFDYVLCVHKVSDLYHACKKKYAFPTVKVCVKPVISYRIFTTIKLEQGAIPLIMCGWPTKRPIMRPVNVPAGSSWV